MRPIIDLKVRQKIVKPESGGVMTLFLEMSEVPGGKYI